MTSEHPDANQLAAFAERKLLREERQEILAHLADCADCRQVIALASQKSEEPVFTRPAHGWWRVASAAAAMALVVAATWGLRVAIRSPEKAVPQTTAALKSVTASLPGPALAPAPPEVEPAAKTSQPVRQKAAISKRVLAPAPAQAVPSETRSELQSSSAKSSEVPRSSAHLLAGSRFAFRDASAAFSSLPSAWRVNSGRVERSLDIGKTWEPTPIDGSVNFRAVEADGFDVWAGGSHGILFHSSDAGSHWRRIEVQDASGHLTGAIVSIRLPQPRQIVLETDSGEQWISVNGIDWRRL